MKALCAINNIFEIKEGVTLDRIKKYIHLSDGELFLEKNIEYCVYGILFRDNAPWFYLCLEEDDESPSPYPAELFEITDARLSSYWRLGTEVSTSGVVTTIVFDEWAKDPSYYERLVDGDPNAVELFKKYRVLMNREK